MRSSEYVATQAFGFLCRHGLEDEARSLWQELGWLDVPAFVAECRVLMLTRLALPPEAVAAFDR